MPDAFVYTTTLTGHVREYLGHLARWSREQGLRLVVVCPEGYTEAGVEVHCISASELRGLRRGWWPLRAWRTVRSVDRWSRRLSIAQARLLFLADAMPFCALPRPGAASISGILYRLEPYLWPRMHWWQRAFSKLQLCLLAHSDNIGVVFTLADGSAAAALNHIYKTDKFRRLPDPVVPTSSADLQGSISPRRYSPSLAPRSLVHFGGLCRRKGTLTLLDALLLMPPEERSRYHLTLAGVAYDDIAGELPGRLRELADVVTYLPGWRSEAELLSLCLAADAIVAPYENIAQSSGLLGWAARTGTPIIVPSEGLLGKLARRYRLGMCCSAMAEGLRVAFGGYDYRRVDGSAYLRLNRPEEFAVELMAVVEK